jgi:hypothetical protein
LDADDHLEKQEATAVLSGIYSQLSALEMVVYAKR